MKEFISCDWGTSALRLRLVDATAMTVLTEVMSLDGVSNTFELWKKTGKAEEERLFFYQSVLTEQIKILGQQMNVSLENVPLIVSGMASSNIGMIELPYKEMPFTIDGSNLKVRIIESNNNFQHHTFLISGAKTTDDVMRGEETQLIGSVNENQKEAQLFIFPGTHSKHVIIRNGKALAVKTYMTGEFFELLSKKSILSDSIKEGGDLFNNKNLESFKKGIADSIHTNLLHSSFLIRTNSLLDKLSKEENYYYLTGLLIGTELKEISSVKMPITIVGNQQLSELYKMVLDNLGVHDVKCIDAGKAVINGHCKILSSFK